MSEYQDPLLTPGHIKKIVQNLPGKVKLSHEDYEYDDCDTLENEINDFFNFSEVVEELNEYRKAYEETYTQSLSWKSLNDSKRRQRIHSLLEQLGGADKIGALKSLLYIALGNFNFSLKQDHRIADIKRNSALIYHCSGFPIIYRKLQSTIMQYKSLLSQIPNNLYFEINGYLTLLYLLIETQRRGSNKFTHELEFLSSILIYLNEKTDPLFPTKKVVLLFWKCMLAISGGLDAIKGLNEEVRKSKGLINPDMVAKCKPHDLLNFQSEMTDKYSGYVTQELPVRAPISVSTLLTASLEQPNAKDYHPSLPRSTSFSIKKQENKKKSVEYEYFDNNGMMVLPVKEDQLPFSIKEATETYFQNMYISLGDYQIIQERLKGYTDQQVLSIEPFSLQVIETIFEKLVPELRTILVFLLKLLLQMVTEQEEESMDTIRNKEIYSKSISAIFLLLLKWTKASHVLKFEYISQLLIDSGCLLLMLKIMGMYDLTVLVGKRTDIKQYCFLNYHIQEEEQKEEEEESEIYTNRRNMFWIINYQRILQMLTKNKPHRIMMLVHYKSSVILKHVLKISHTDMEYYALKLLKSQVPYLGKKWKSINMKVISAIYLRCYTSLKDDWISGPELNGDSEEAKIQEMNIRILTRLYIGEHYLPDLLPMTSDQNTISSSDELDPLFTEDYEAWLNREVFLKQEDEEEEPEEIVNDSPMTPIPANYNDTFSHEKLIDQMNKLYLEELNGELKGKDVQEELYDILFRVEEKTMEKWSNS